jgi:hypothetical protein
MLCWGGGKGDKLAAHPRLRWWDACRPAHLRRVGGVARLSLDNRFTRQTLAQLADLLRELNLSVIAALRRSTAAAATAVVS